MNETAVDTEEQIVSLFPEQETVVCGGWILKMYAKRLWVHPLYCILDGDIDERIRICEEIGKYKAAKCAFRIAECTNYYLRSRLIEENNYCFKSYATVSELNLTDKMLTRITKGKQKTCIPEISVIQRKNSDSGIGTIELAVADEETIQGKPDGKAVGKMWIDTLFFFDGSLLSDSALWNVLQFAADNRIKKILINLAGCDSLPEMYREYGFQKLYSCYCYEKQEENENEFAK
ncbi:MAG: hypothetical protein K2J90_01760 [Lachnospiraceae bacterium]|nr:hypothetical protein [Lachnospiraceae bacterium]